MERRRAFGPVTVHWGKMDHRSHHLLGVDLWRTGSGLLFELRTPERYFEARRTRGWFRIQRAGERGRWRNSGEG
jgi:hypothetical protein